MPPIKEKRKRINLKITPELHQKLMEERAKTGKYINAIIEETLTQKYLHN